MNSRRRILDPRGDICSLSQIVSCWNPVVGIWSAVRGTSDAAKVHQRHVRDRKTVEELLAPQNGLLSLILKNETDSAADVNARSKRFLKKSRPPGRAAKSGPNPFALTPSRPDRHWN
jgi:hypothetical protein